MSKVYLIGSLRNPKVPEVASSIREHGFDVFDDWYAAGPEADDYWRDYERGRNHDLPEALNGYAAQHVFHFDKHHLDHCDMALLQMPAGKSGHLELGYDVMYAFATGVSTDLAEIIRQMEDYEVKVHAERQSVRQFVNGGGLHDISMNSPNWTPVI